MPTSVEHKEPSGERTADRAPAEGQHPKGDNLGARSHTESGTQLDPATLEQALLLIRAIYLSKNAHLGRSRLSGVEQHCIACICDLALGMSADSDCADAELFKQALMRLQEPDLHLSDEQETQP